jgi:hypothetical protein
MAKIDDIEAQEIKETITFSDIINNREVQKRIIYEAMNGSYEKSIRNIVGYVQKHYHMDLDTNEKMRLKGKIMIIILELQAQGEVVKKEKGYVRAKFIIR